MNFLNKIFNRSELSTPYVVCKQLLRDLQPFMYIYTPSSVSDVIIKGLSPSLSTSLSQGLSQQNVVNKKVYLRKHKDELFWAIYISKWGYKEYIMTDRYHNKELEEKQKILDYMNRQQEMPKSERVSWQNNAIAGFKMSNVFIQEVMSDLMTNIKTTQKTAIIMSIYYEMQIVLANPTIKTYVEYMPTKKSDDIAIIYMDDNGHLYIIDDVNADTSYTTNKIQSEYIQLLIGNEMQSIKGIASYKLSDLETIAKKLDIASHNNDKKWKKTELYNAIISRIS